VHSGGRKLLLYRLLSRRAKQRCFLGDSVQRQAVLLAALVHLQLWLWMAVWALLQSQLCLATRQFFVNVTLGFVAMRRDQRNNHLRSLM
jgi:hypothetical protein